MIAIQDLAKRDVGRFVNFTNGVGKTERGCIKSWNDKMDWRNETGHLPRHSV